VGSEGGGGLKCRGHEGVHARVVAARIVTPAPSRPSTNRRRTATWTATSHKDDTGSVCATAEMGQRRDHPIASSAATEAAPPPLRTVALPVGVSTTPSVRPPAYYAWATPALRVTRPQGRDHGDAEGLSCCPTGSWTPRARLGLVAHAAHAGRQRGVARGVRGRGWPRRSACGHCLPRVGGLAEFVRRHIGQKLADRA
jgi:hypothetical protein